MNYNTVRVGENVNRRLSYEYVSAVDDIRTVLLFTRLKYTNKSSVFAYDVQIQPRCEGSGLSSPLKIRLRYLMMCRVGGPDPLKICRASQHMF